MEWPGPGAALASGADQSPRSGPSTAGGGGRMTEAIPAKSNRSDEVRLGTRECGTVGGELTCLRAQLDRSHRATGPIPRVTKRRYSWFLGRWDPARMIDALLVPPHRNFPCIASIEGHHPQSRYSARAGTAERDLLTVR